MEKEDEKIHIWAVVDGEQVFHAAPPAKVSRSSMTAAVHTFLSRAFEELPTDDDEDESRGFM